MGTRVDELNFFGGTGITDSDGVTIGSSTYGSWTAQANCTLRVDQIIIANTQTTAGTPGGAALLGIYYAKTVALGAVNLCAVVAVPDGDTLVLDFGGAEVPCVGNGSATTLLIKGNKHANNKLVITIVGQEFPVLPNPATGVAASAIGTGWNTP